MRARYVAEESVKTEDVDNEFCAGAPRISSVRCQLGKSSARIHSGLWRPDRDGMRKRQSNGVQQGLIVWDKASPDVVAQQLATRCFEKT